MPDRPSSLQINPARGVTLPAGQQPMLVVVIDCEEDFDWRRPLRDTEFSLESTQRLGGIQDVFAEFGVVPTYAVGYPIVDHATAWMPLADLLRQGKCLIGAHLHPWVTPPFLEVSNLRNSFPSNLPMDLQLAKLRVLTDRIAERFAMRPTIYKAGRYGFGPGTVAALRELGFEIDISFMPHWEFISESGPSYLEEMASLFWLNDERTLLEIPTTSGFTGGARACGPTLYRQIDTRLLRFLRVPAVLARSGILNRVRLTPEGVRLDEAKALTRALLRDGQIVFQLAFHSTSLVPRSAPYVQSDVELGRFIEWIRRYLAFFRDDVGGVPISHAGILAKVAAMPPLPAAL